MEKVDLTGKVAIVTGGGNGLGRSYAIGLAEYGAKVIVNDLGGETDGRGSSTEPASKVAEEIISAGGEAIANFDNIVTGADNIVKSALDAYGTVDILVNNAGIVRDKIFVKMDNDSWEKVLDVHLKGTYSCIKAVWPVMRKKNYGRIVNISSGTGLFGNIGQANYAAAKSAVIGLTNVLKLEGLKKNILVNVVAPIAASRLTEKVMSPEISEKSKTELVTPIVVYLCSEQCRENGSVFNAGMGYFSRSAIATGEGWTGGKGTTPDDILRNFEKIKSMDKIKYFNNLYEQMEDYLSHVSS